MFGPPPGTRVYLACGATDMRKGFDGLAAQVQAVLAQDVHSGAVFCFRGRRGDLTKLLVWGGQGLVLIAKRLERGKFVSYGLCQPLWSRVSCRPRGGRWLDRCTRSAWVRTPGVLDGRSDSYAGVGYPMMTVRRRAASLWPRTWATSPPVQHEFEDPLYRARRPRWCGSWVGGGLRRRAARAGRWTRRTRAAPAPPRRSPRRSASRAR